MMKLYARTLKVESNYMNYFNHKLKKQSKLLRDNKHIKHRILEPRILTKFHKVARGNQIVKSVVDVNKMNDGVQQNAFLNNDPNGNAESCSWCPKHPFCYS